MKRDTLMNALSVAADYYSDRADRYMNTPGREHLFETFAQRAQKVRALIVAIENNAEIRLED